MVHFVDIGTNKNSNKFMNEDCSKNEANLLSIDPIFPLELQHRKYYLRKTAKVSKLLNGTGLDHY